MRKPDQKIIVVKKNILFNNGKDFFEGFAPCNKINYESRILNNMTVMRRGDSNEELIPGLENAERNTEYKQPIGYAVILNKKTEKIFAYQRSANDKHYTEKRLQGKWSWGFGGHIEAKERKNVNPIRESVSREINEEVSIQGNIKPPKTAGYIYHDFGVNAVHFGILYIIETDVETVVPKDNEIEIIEAKSPSELEKMCESQEFNVEDWSKTALIPLRNFYKF